MCSWTNSQNVYKLLKDVKRWQVSSRKQEQPILQGVFVQDQRRTGQVNKKKKMTKNDWRESVSHSAFFYLSLNLSSPPSQQVLSVIHGKFSS